MMMHALNTVRSSRHRALQALAATCIGLLGLPLAAAAFQPSELRAWLWLSAALLTSLWLLVTAPALMHTLEQFVSRIPLRAGEPAGNASHVPLEVARLLVAAGYLIVVQAAVRRPLVELVGAGAEPFMIEALLAGGALTALLVLLASIHRAARPLVEGVAWLTLDAVVATSEPSVNAPNRGRGDERASASPAAPTLLAPRRAP